MTYPLAPLGLALRQANSDSGLIKGEAESSHSPGLIPAFSASGQDVWVSPERNYETRPGIVLSAVGARSGKTFLATQPKWSTVANTTAWTFSDNAEPRFIQYITNDEDFWVKGGAAQPYVQVASSLRQRIPFPPRETQRRIADHLDRETDQIDETITRIDRVVELLQERRTSELNHTILSGIRGKNTRQLSSDWIPYISENWSTTQLGILGQLQTGLTLGKQWNEHTKEYPYLRVANVQVGELDLAEVKSVPLPPRVASDFTIPHNAVLMTEGGDRDKLGRGTIWNSEIPNCLHQNHVFAFKCGPLLSPHFLVAYLESQYARKYFELTGTQATNLASTNSTKVKALPVPLPEINEQREIVAHLNILDEEHQRMTTSAMRTKELLRERRSALITAAVNGKIDI